MINVNRPRDRRRLLDAVKQSRRAQAPFRESRRKALEEYAGDQFRQEIDTSRRQTLANLLQLTAEVYTLALAANNPRVLISTRHLMLEPFARRYQVAVNDLIVEIELEQTIQRCVLDAFFGFGVAKTTLADSGVVEIAEGVLVDPGRPYVARISPDDWFVDGSVNAFEKIRFCGDRYEIYRQEAEESGVFDRKVLRQLDEYRRDHAEADDDEHAKRMSGVPKGEDQTLGPRIKLQDVWLPRESQLVTFAVGYDDLPPLSVQEWDGPEQGPYAMLSLIDVPDNVMPASPADAIRPLHDLFNSLYRKAARQARRQKDVTVFEGEAQADAQRIQKSNDGDMTRVDRRESVDILKFGGTDQVLLAFTIGVRDLFSQQAGNLDAMAGLGPQSGTVGQDQLIKDTVSARHGQLAQRVTKFTERITRNLAWMLWVDEVHEQEGQMTVPGLDFPLPTRWTPEEREGDFFQYNFTVEPHSQAYKSPSQRANELMQFVMQVAVPMAPMIQQQGGIIDMQELTRQFSELMNLPRLERIIKWQQPQQPEGPSGQPPGGRQSPVTTRHNVRHNVPTGGTPDSRRQVLMQSMLPGGSQNYQQSASMGRSGA